MGYLSWTTFYLACLDDKDQVRRFDVKPIFRSLRDLAKYLSEIGSSIVKQTWSPQEILNELTQKNQSPTFTKRNPTASDNPRHGSEGPGIHPLFRTRLSVS
jgi:hypothetical protein